MQAYSMKNKLYRCWNTDVDSVCVAQIIKNAQIMI